MLTGENIYEGSPYHKRYPSEWGAAGLLSDKTECPEEVAPDAVKRILDGAIRSAIESGFCSLLKDGEWPRYAWGRTTFPTHTDEQRVIVWEARVNNRTLPTYKAYPISRRRHSGLMPPHVEEQLWPNR